MVEVSKIASTTSKLAKAKAHVMTDEEASRARKRLAEIRAKNRNRKNTLMGGQKPSETYKKFGFFGY